MLIPFKMDYSCCFGLGGNLDFLDFLQKSFLTSTTGGVKRELFTECIFVQTSLKEKMCFCPFGLLILFLLRRFKRI